MRYGYTGLYTRPPFSNLAWGGGVKVENRRGGGHNLHPLYVLTIFPRGDEIVIRRVNAPPMKPCLHGIRNCQKGNVCMRYTHMTTIALSAFEAPLAGRVKALG